MGGVCGRTRHVIRAFQALLREFLPGFLRDHNRTAGGNHLHCREPDIADRPPHRHRLRVGTQRDGTLGNHIASQTERHDISRGGGDAYRSSDGAFGGGFRDGVV